MAEANSKEEKPKEAEKSVAKSRTEDAETKDSKKSSKVTMPGKKALIWVGGVIVAILVVVLVGFSILIYKYKSDSSLVYDVSRVIPYPAEKVNGTFVSYGEFLFELNSVKQYYKSQSAQNGQAAIDFNSADGKAKLATLRTQIMAQLTTDTVTRQLISKNKITVTKKEVNDQVNQIVTASGGMDKVKSVLAKFYGWTLDDLKGKVKFQLAKQKLQDKLSSDNSLNAQAKAKADDIVTQLNAGGDFAALAKKYSQDTTASNGGDLGFFTKGQMVKPFEDAAFALQPGQISGVVKTQFGYHIIKVIEFNADKTQVHAAHILIKPIDFDQYVKDQVNQAKVSKYLKV